MSTDENETIADIVAELHDVSRADKYTATANPKLLSPTVLGKPICAYFAEAADRIEAAWKRERDSIYEMLDNSITKQRMKENEKH